MPKISREGGPTYAGNEGVVRDARDELYTVNPVREGEEGTVVREPGDPNTDSAEQARRDAGYEGDAAEHEDRGARNQQTDAASQDQAETAKSRGGESASDGNSSKASSKLHGSTIKKN